VSGLSFDPNWARWIRASLNTSFINSLKTTYSEPGQIYIEGSTRQTNQFDKWIELRLTGLYMREESGYWRFNVDYDVLVSCNISPDVYTIDRMAGDVAAAFLSSIPLLKLGTGMGDDGSALGCLNLDTQFIASGIRINQFGLVMPNLTVNQASVEGRYWIILPS